MAAVRPRVRSTCIAFIIGVFAALPLAAATDVRQISEAERAAVDHALAYLSGGPEALVARLSSTSPLRKLSPADAAKEIEARLGPPGGATWELQTVVPALADKMAVFDIGYQSGVDDSATFDLKKEGDTYKIENIRILAEESLVKPIFPAPPKEAGTKTKEAPLPADNIVLALGLIACAVAAAAAFVRRSNKAMASFAIPVAALFAIGALAVAVMMSETVQIKNTKKAAAAVAAANVESYPRIGSLLETRRAMASGRELTVVPSREKTEVARNVAQLWKAQMDLQQMRIDDAKHTLERFPVPSSIPLVEVLRGRLALFEQDEGRSAVSYEHAVSLGPGRDGLLVETASALLALGYEDRAARYFERLDRVGSRDADVYYTLSMLRASRNKEDEAEKMLSRAWKLRPARRADVIGAQVLWSVIRKPETGNYIDLSKPDESVVQSDKVATRKLDLPVAAIARVSGDFLDVQIADMELIVPGGACLAPPNAQVVDAATWQRMEEDKGIQDYERLVASAGNAAAYAQPVLRRRITSSALALAERNRWADLVRLTDGVSPKSEHIPPLVFFLRATALERLQRTQEAKDLLVSLAAGRVLQRKRDAQSLEQLGEMLANLDMYDLAVKLLEKANSIKQSERIGDTVAQVQMNKRLATKYQTFKSDHFEIHYPDEISPASATLISQILENELKRLQSWVPIKDFKPVVVNIVWWQDFSSVITGNDFTLGLYQGKITVPLAGIPVYPPEIVAILTHELCHAMLAQATSDQAPRWFQEGMAKRSEMVGIARNAFNMYDDSKLLAFTLLDSVMRDSPDPEMIGEGYFVAEAVIRYIEAKYGKAGIGKMIESYRNGATTVEAVQALTGGTMAEFDHQFRQWGRAERRVFDSPIIARYDLEEPEIRVHGGQPATQTEPSGETPQRGRLTGGTFYPLKKP